MTVCAYVVIIRKIQKQQIHERMNKTNQKRFGHWVPRFLCVVLFSFVCVATQSHAQESTVKKKTTAVPLKKQLTGWIDIGRFDSITGEKNGEVHITDSTGTLITNISQVVPGSTYILKRANTGLWVIPPGSLAKGRYYEIETTLNANVILISLSRPQKSPEKNFPGYWIKVKVIQAG